MNLETAPQGDLLEPWRSVPALADALNNGATRPTFTVAALRNQLARRHENGLGPYVRKIGRKLIVSEPGYNHWLSQHPCDAEAA
jgi:hypothetical protein